MSKITKRVVDAIKPNPKKEIFIWDSGDGSLKGFGIRVKPSGAASYLVQYRNKEGRTRRFAFSKVGVLTPEEARQEAKDKLAAVDKGGDPSAERHADRDSMTVAELCDLYFQEGAGHVKPSTIAGDKCRTEAHIKPLLGRRVAKGLTLTDIEKFQADIAAGKTAKERKEKGRGGHAKGGRGTAARTIDTLSIIMEFGKRRSIIGVNPTRGVKKFASEKRRRFLSIEEITSLGKVMRESAATENKTGIAAIRSLLLTGCRKNEILGLPWAWLDAKGRCIRFDDTKSGAQLRPIGSTAAEYLKSQPKKKISKGKEKKESPWIFPADHGEGHFIGLPKVLERLCKKAGIEGVSLHILRHTFAATAAELGYSELTIAGMLGHTVPGVTARYAHVPDSALVSAASSVSAKIMAALEGREEGAKVVPMTVTNVRV